MSSVESLKEFVNERLTVAAEEIFRVFKRIIVQYEEEIERQRGRPDHVLKPHATLQRTEFTLQHFSKEDENEEEREEDEGFDYQQLSFQEQDSGLNQESSGIKEEQEQLIISQEGEQLLLKPQASMLNCHDGIDHLLLFHNPTEDQHGRPGTVSEPVAEHGRNIDHRATAYNSNMTDSDCSSRREELPVRCDTCGDIFNCRSALQMHLKIHTGKKLHRCKTCGKVFRNVSGMKAHVRIHTGEKPYSCQTCGKDFRYNSELGIHMRTHTGEKPFLCKICGNNFRHAGDLRIHMRIHTGEKPFACSTCGKTFCRKSQMKRHMRIHTRGNPFPEDDHCESNVCKRFPVHRRSKQLT